MAGKQKNGKILVKFADGTSEEYPPEEVLMGLDEVEGVRHVDIFWRKTVFLGPEWSDVGPPTLF